MRESSVHDKSVQYDYHALLASIPDFSEDMVEFIEKILNNQQNLLSPLASNNDLSAQDSVISINSSDHKEMNEKGGGDTIRKHSQYEESVISMVLVNHTDIS